jgi:hypothetical protein
MVQVTATPETGWLFVNWKLDRVDAGPDNPITVTIDTDHTVTAVLEEEIIPPEYSDR